ncbi:DUF5719 family protein [Angustibacter sp. McL0619]|uniref:DUF5719 family protein n=1 Tax=Angustibacter sp. McL0619 TaxID=3415676 RepID=UPI003CEDF26E
MSVARWAQLGAKLAVPVLGLGVVAVAVTIPPARAGQPTSAKPRTPHAVPVDARDLVCPGPETVGVRGAASSTAPAPAQVFGAAPSAALRPAANVGGAAATGTLQVVAGKQSSAPIGTGQDLSARVGTGVTSDVSPVVRARGAAAPGAVAEQVTLVPTGDLRALSSATCTEPSDDIWLVGGGTDVGRRGRLVLSNPHESTAQVSVDVLGETGPVTRTPGSTVALAAHSRTVLLLDALAPDVKAPVVHVRSSGGTVSAVLNDSWLDGTTPLGGDDVVASLPAARTVLVPGVRVQGAGALLRIAVPGPSEAVTQVRLIGEKGDVDLGDEAVVRVPAGSSHDVDLSAVPAGAYAVQVTSDEPVVAGAMVRTAQTAAGADLAWSASSSPVSSLIGLAYVAQPAGWQTDLLLSTPAKAGSIDVVSVGADGAITTSTVDLTGGITRVVPLVGASVWLKPRPGGGPVLAAREMRVQLATGLLITSLPLRPVVLSRVPADIAAAAD